MEEHLKKMYEEIKNQEAKLYDVREQDEWDEGHLIVAEHLPLSKLRQDELVDKVDRDKKSTSTVGVDRES